MESEKSHNPTGSQDSGKKRGTLENLTKEELVAKCKALLGIAQKAKQAKDEYGEKNKILLNKLSEYETQKEADKGSLLAMKEMVENLTQNKLTLTLEITELKTQNSKFSEVLIKNEALERQLKRITDENEDLISDLEKLETKFLQTSKEYSLQQTASDNKVKDLSQKLIELEKIVSELNDENLTLKQACEKTLSTEIIESSEDSNKNINIEEIQTQSLELSSEIKRMKNRELRLLDEIQHLKNKINDVGLKFKKLKECRKVLMENEIDYSESISKWQEDIKLVSRKLLAYICALEKDKQDLQRCIQLDCNQEINYMIGIEKKIQSLIRICDKAVTKNPENIKEIDEMKLSAISQQNLDDGLINQIDALKVQLSELVKEKEDNDSKREIISNFAKVQDENDLLRKSIQEQISNFDELKLQNNQTALSLKSTQESYNSLKQTFEDLSEDIKHRVESEKLLKEEIGDLIENFEHKSNIFKNTVQEHKETIDRLKLENSELLNEMRELNEALKGRGDVISRQQNTILSLETQIKDISDHTNEPSLKESRENSALNIKKTTDHSTPATTSALVDNQSDVLSLSSITKTEDSKRMQDVNESLEEKYNKLKMLAVKMKRKIQEQKVTIVKYENKENEREADLQSDQTHNLLDKEAKKSKVASLEIVNFPKEMEFLKNKLEENRSEIESLRNVITLHDENIKEKEKTLQNEIKLRKSKEQIVLEKTNEIKILKQEKDAFNLIRRELEKEKDVLKNKLNDKEKEVNKLNELLEKLKKDLERSKAIGKQSSVLNLEIEAYEKSLNENAEKLNAMKIQNQELTESTKFKESAISSLKQEIKLLEENVNSEKLHSTELKQQIDSMHMKFKEVEHEKLELQSKLQDYTVENELKHSLIEDLRLQISDISAKKDKQITDLTAERKNIHSTLAKSEEQLKDCESKSKIIALDLENVRKEYANYKIRAQSILRENQNKETSRERELEEELTTMRANFEAVNIKLEKNIDITENQGKRICELKEENEQIQKRSREIMDLLEESREQYDSLLEENRKQSKEYQESLKAHRLQIETLTNCYKEQIIEQEHKHSMAIEEFKKNNSAMPSSRVGPFGSSGVVEQSQPQKSLDEQKVEMLLMEREDAEGSEASYTIPKRKVSSTRSKHDVIPLDELLNSSLDENLEEIYVNDDTKVSAESEVIILKEKLQSEEIKNKHLTSLLSETEQDLIKYTQLSEILKEELRRQERTLEREKHMHNSEYLKNIIIKFLTLSNGDERLRLVPVLNTILRLSPDETNVLQNVARGTDTNRSWNLLPIWSNSNH